MAVYDEGLTKAFVVCISGGNKNQSGSVPLSCHSSLGLRRASHALSEERSRKGDWGGVLDTSGVLTCGSQGSLFSKLPSANSICTHKEPSVVGCGTRRQLTWRTRTPQAREWGGITQYVITLQ